MAVAVTVRFWAGARRAAGRSDAELTASTVGDLLEQLKQQAGMADVIPACSVLIDGAAGSVATPLEEGAIVDLLPPFAGG